MKVEYERMSVEDEIMQDNDILVYQDENIGVFILDEKGTILSCNNQAEKLLHSDTESLFHKKISEFIPELMNKPILIHGQLNNYLSYLSHFGYIFEIISEKGNHFPGFLFFHIKKSLSHSRICLLMTEIEANKPLVC